MTRERDRETDSSSVSDGHHLSVYAQRGRAKESERHSRDRWRDYFRDIVAASHQPSRRRIAATTQQQLVTLFVSEKRGSPYIHTRMHTAAANGHGSRGT